jgi:hypothetical protein
MGQHRRARRRSRTCARRRLAFGLLDPATEVFMKRLVFLVPLLLTGCADLLSTNVTITDDKTAQVKVKVGIAGQCNDRQTITDETGTTTWNETPTLVDGVLQQCTIDAQWDGDLLSLAKLHQDAVDKCGSSSDPTDHCDPDELDLAMSFTITGASFVAGAEKLTREQLVSLTARATTGGAVMFEMDKATPLPLALDADPGVKDQLKAAYLSGGKLRVTAIAHIVLSGNDVRRLQEQSPTGTLIVELSSHLEGSIDVHP